MLKIPHTSLIFAAELSRKNLSIYLRILSVYMSTGPKKIYL